MVRWKLSLLISTLLARGYSALTATLKRSCVDWVYYRHWLWQGPAMDDNWQVIAPDDPDSIDRRTTSSEGCICPALPNPLSGLNSPLWVTLTHGPISRYNKLCPDLDFWPINWPLAYVYLKTKLDCLTMSKIFITSTCSWLDWNNTLKLFIYFERLLSLIMHLLLDRSTRIDKLESETPLPVITPELCNTCWELYHGVHIKII